MVLVHCERERTERRDSTPAIATETAASGIVQLSMKSTRAASGFGMHCQPRRRIMRSRATRINVQRITGSRGHVCATGLGLVAVMISPSSDQSQGWTRFNWDPGKITRRQAVAKGRTSLPPLGNQTSEDDVTLIYQYSRTLQEVVR